MSLTSIRERLSILPSVAVIALVSCLPLSIANATETGEEPPVLERFNDWELVCPSPDTCRIGQRLASPETNETLFVITALRASEGGPFVGIVSVPLRGYLAPGIELRVDGGRAYRILYETCDPAGCHAGFPLEGAVLDAFRRGLDARFRVWTAQERPVDVGVSLRGFTRALEALRERTQEAIDKSDVIIDATRLNNPRIPAGFAKYRTETFQSPSGNFAVHLYANPQTGQVYYGLDYKIKFSQVIGNEAEICQSHRSSPK